MSAAQCSAWIEEVGLTGSDVRRGEALARLEALIGLACEELLTRAQSVRSILPVCALRKWWWLSGLRLSRCVLMAHCEMGGSHV